jgi:hypothetical protein
MHGRRCFLIVLAVTITLGCKILPSNYFASTPSLLRGNPSEVRQQLLTHIPIGTPRKDADQLVKSLGLELTPHYELGSVAVDSIECRHTGANGLFAETVWLIRIDCPEGKVADIVCDSISLSYW